MSFPIDQVRAEFPALAVQEAGGARIYFDAPGGTQACRRAIDAMAGHLALGTANAGGAFAVSVETDAMSERAHAAAADLLGGEAGEIAFGPNMTSLTLSVSRSLARDWRAGDEIVLSRLDHDANVWPWVMAAEDRDVTVRWLDLDPADGTLRLDQLPGLVGPRTRLVAFGGASNALGTLNDIAEIVRLVKAGSEAIVFVDAVQSVPHVPTDVRALGCDLLACSPYKFFGPHQGILWGRAELMKTLEAYKVRPASTEPPAVRFETGTPSFEAQAGLLGTIDYLEWLGRALAPTPPASRRDALLAAMQGCVSYERILGEHLLDGLRQIESATLYGPPTMDGRVPTFAFTLDGVHPRDVAERLARHRIHAWSGHFYAIEPVRRLGLWESGGLVRVGLCHYSTLAEVERLLDCLAGIAAGGD
ncbi:cysteine desulfurase-like protein [Sphingosinicella terrae]|uniref:cysteine desulfurase-like protein n=1 Tax=Sphingosinicella terrae TaxID=2172047 RepID=UPI000E0DEE91|nr:cysteine desulfurase-like protein [Sphingosinicella terrae]